MILELIQRLKNEGEVSIIMVLHNYVHVLATCDRVNLIQDGMIALDKPTAETSVEELTQIVVEEYRRARQEAIAADAARGASAPGGTVSERAYALGVDFGTESGRALLLDLDSGAELAVSEVRYEHGVIDRELPGDGRAAAARLGAAAPRRLARGARHRDPGCARAGSRGARSRGRARRRLHLVHGAAGERRRDAAVSPRSAGARDAMPGRSCGSTTPPSRSPTA